VKSHGSNDSHNWTDRVFRCLVGQWVPEDVATAAVGAWIIAGHADAASVVLFTSASRYVRAFGGRDSAGNVEIEVDSGRESITTLFAPEQISGLGCSPQQVDTHIWPDRLAACFVSPGRSAPPAYVAGIAAGILGRASPQQTIVPCTDRMEAMAEFAAGAGHEINNPLGSIIGQTQLLLRQEQLKERRQALATIGSQAWRIRDMIGDCMLFARPPAPDLQTCELREIVRQAAISAVNALECLPECLEFDLPTMPVTLDIDPSQIRMLVTHLVRNSVEAGLNGEIEADIHVELIAEANAVMLTVHDQGPGISDDNMRRHLFDPFFSGRQAGRGIGFGLPVCWQIARNHGGLILQESTDHGGARFVVGLPRGC